MKNKCIVKAAIYTVIFITVCLAAFVFSCCGCSLESDPESGIGGFEGRKTGNAIKIVNWNLQTFFDAQTTGSEYSEFKGSKTAWDSAHYLKRVQQLCSFIVEQDADVYAFEEIENVGVLQDISNNLPAINKGKNPWQYACFGNSENSSLGCAVLSRYELSDFQLHQLDYRVAYSFSSFSCSSQYSRIVDGVEMDPPSMRPLLEVTICKGVGLRLFVCHWKSKSGDEDGETAIWRQLQERLLVDRILSIKDSSQRYLICGDFNQRLDEFDIQGCVLSSTSKSDTKVLLHNSDATVMVYSPWTRNDNDGSYYYDDEWEKIDNFFASKNLNLQSFTSINEGDHVENDIPMRYDIWADKGWSDHLPISCWVGLN